MPAVRYIVALDIGGANIKASDGEHLSLSQPFALWREPERLSAAIVDILRRFPSPTTLAVTMTGELADCFATKAEGVDRILGAVEQAAPQSTVAVWQTGGEFLAPSEARDLVPLVAAANWHALASWAARSVSTGAGLLIDIGSTTTDIIPLRDGGPATTGHTDLERLLAHELVYTGVRRTPLCAVLPAVPLRGRECPLAAELFATMLDIYLILGNIAEDEDDLNTANGRPATFAAAHDRLARMLCCDVSEVDTAERTVVAQAFAVAQQQRLTAAVKAVLARSPQPCGQIIITGEGEFLAERILIRLPETERVPRVSLSRTLGDAHSQSACAYALARLARERSTP
ncbi:MAG: hypothetical protein JNG89_20455 [Planctomycetaceae bacterium]|nr:hypothetical protein [Planctomycetaceae bacterium]